MAEALRKRVWAARLTRSALVLSIGGVLAALIAAWGSGNGAWHFHTGFLILRVAFFAAVAAVLFAIVSMLLVRRSGGRRMGLNLVALVIGLLFILYIGNQVARARSVPAIHDISTNLDDWPKFYRLRVRGDNLASIPDEGQPRLARLRPRERWKAVHRAHYGGIHTIMVPWTVQETVKRAQALARERGWDIVTSDPEMGIVEAVDTSRFFRFKDNVVVRARPAPGGGSLVDMRSISRVGVSDLGVNAERVRDFLRDLKPS